MTTQYMTWLTLGILGKSWNFGWLDGTQAVRSWLVPRRKKGGGILMQCACPRAVGLKDLLGELTQNNDRFTAPGGQSHKKIWSI